VDVYGLCAPGHWVLDICNRIRDSMVHHKQKEVG